MINQKWTTNEKLKKVSCLKFLEKKHPDDCGMDDSILKRVHCCSTRLNSNCSSFLRACMSANWESVDGPTWTKGYLDISWWTCPSRDFVSVDLKSHAAWVHIGWTWTQSNAKWRQTASETTIILLSRHIFTQNLPRTRLSQWAERASGWKTARAIESM